MVMGCPINHLSKVLTLSIETFCWFIDKRISHDCNFILLAIPQDTTSSIFTGIARISPLVNPCDWRKESVGIR